jgi:signal transduction histidine kinase
MATDSRRLSERVADAVESTAPRIPAEAGDASHPPARGHQRQRQVHAAETRLLYENASTGIAVSIVIALLLAYAQWDAAPRVIVLAWLLYMLLAAAARYLLVQRYWRASPSAIENGRWNAAFVIGTALAAAGWAAGAVVLMTAVRPMNDVLVVFEVGGVMLGGASLLAARPDAFITFMLPPRCFTALRLALQADEQHVMMGFLAAVFTVATILTSWRFHCAIESSLELRFHNQDLVESLQIAKDDADALNRELELRVRDRTARLTEADQRKDEFLAMLAHELRNPLAPIRFALESLKWGSDPAMAARAREVIERQVDQLVRLVDDLLDVSRITAN